MDKSCRIAYVNQYFFPRKVAVLLLLIFIIAIKLLSFYVIKLIFYWKWFWGKIYFSVQIITQLISFKYSHNRLAQSAILLINSSTVLNIFWPLSVNRLHSQWKNHVWQESLFSYAHINQQLIRFTSYTLHDVNSWYLLTETKFGRDKILARWIMPSNMENQNSLLSSQSSINTGLPSLFVAKILHDSLISYE